MKIILEENDLKRIKQIREELEKDPEKLFYVNELNRTYSIEFTVDDLAKANNFIFHLMIGRGEIVEHIRENTGINIKALNYATKNEMIKELKNKIDDFFNTEMVNYFINT